MAISIQRESSPERRRRANLIFHRAPEEGVRSPGDVESLLKDEGFVTARVVGRNPITHDQWWITGISIAKTGVPYVVALAAVIRAWLNDRKGRQVRLETKTLKICANSVEDVDSILKKLRKYERDIESIHVTKAVQKRQKNGDKN